MCQQHTAGHHCRHLWANLCGHDVTTYVVIPVFVGHLIHKHHRNAAADAQQMFLGSGTQESDVWQMCGRLCLEQSKMEVPTLMSKGVSRLLRSFLCTHRKLISTMLLVLPRIQIVAGTAAQSILELFEGCQQVVMVNAACLERQKAQDDVHHPEVSLANYMGYAYCLHICMFSCPSQGPVVIGE